LRVEGAREIAKEPRDFFFERKISSVKGA